MSDFFSLDLSSEVLIERLTLQPHPEGGHYRRIFTSPASIETSYGIRPSMTAIYYLLQESDFSAWHRIRSHELWHFHSGCDGYLHQIDAKGQLKTERLGRGGVMVVDVPPNTWFAAEICRDSLSHAHIEAGFEPYALFSCTVSPGFDFSDFELANREELVSLYPRHLDLICRLTRE